MPFAKNNSLSLRLTGWYLLVFVISTGLLLGAVGLEVRSVVQQRGIETVSSELQAHRRVLESEGTSGLRQFAAQAHRIAQESLYLRLVEGDGTIVFEYQSTSAVRFQTDSLSPVQEGLPYRSIRGRDGTNWELGSMPLEGGRLLQLALRDERSEKLLNKLHIGLIVGWLMTVVLGLAGGFILARISLKPIHQLTHTARQVMVSGDLNLRVPESGIDGDLRELSHLFNGVLIRNQNLMQRMREALDNVAHDLRTPLTRLRTGAEVALHQVTEASPIRDALAGTLEESDEVLRMLSSLMDITEAENGVMRLTLNVIDISTLVEDSIALYAHVAEERGVRVTSTLQPAIQIRGDRLRLHQAIANLLDNALKYTNPGGWVQLKTHREHDWALLVVQDNGIGIPEEDLPRIWTRLFRGDASRSQRGLGLGLSFVKAIVEAHGGQVTAESNGQGSTFTIRLRTA